MKLKAFAIHFVLGVLPVTRVRIGLGKVETIEEYEKKIDEIGKFFYQMILCEYTTSWDRRNINFKIITTRTTQSALKRINIPRIRRIKKKNIKKNLVAKIEGEYAYINVSYLKKRRVLKIDLEDLPILQNKCKNSYYFIGRYFKTTNDIQFIFSKNKKRPNSIYSLIFGRKILTKVIHKDGDIFNYSKANLEITEQTSSKIDRTKKYENVLTKSEEEYVGITKYSDVQGYPYSSKILFQGYRFKIGRFKTAKEAAMAYDVCRMYFLGNTFSVNFPCDYYFNFEQEFVQKWITRISRWKFVLKNDIGMKIVRDSSEVIPQEQRKTA